MECGTGSKRTPSGQRTEMRYYFTESMFRKAESLGAAKSGKLLRAYARLFFDGVEADNLPGRAQDVFDGMKGSIRRYRAATINGSKSQCKNESKNATKPEQVSDSKNDVENSAKTEGENGHSTAETESAGTHQTQSGLPHTSGEATGSHLINNEVRVTRPPSNPLPYGETPYPPSNEQKPLSYEEALELDMLIAAVEEDPRSLTDAEKARFHELYPRRNLRGGEDE